MRLRNRALRGRCEEDISNASGGPQRGALVRVPDETYAGGVGPGVQPCDAGVTLPGGRRDDCRAESGVGDKTCAGSGGGSAD